MLEELKEEEIVKKVGGRFKLSTLIQKRLVQLNAGSRALVEAAAQAPQIGLPWHRGGTLLHVAAGGKAVPRGQTGSGREWRSARKMPPHRHPSGPTLTKPCRRLALAVRSSHKL